MLKSDFGDDAPLQRKIRHTPSNPRTDNEFTVIELHRLRSDGRLLYPDRSKDWIDEPDGRTPSFTITYLDIISTAFSIFMRAATVFINIRLAYDFYMKGEHTHFIWTTICIVVPMVITTLIYANMCYQDGLFNKGACKAMQTLWLVFLSSFLFRYWRSLVYAVRCKNAEKSRDMESQIKYYKLTVREESDVAFLRLFECFLEAAPQKILQISIVLQSFDQISFLQILAILSYFGSMAWCLAAYHRCNRYAQVDKHNINNQGLVAQLCWHFCISVSRTLCIAFVVTIFPFWIILACLLHALILGFVTFIVDRPKFAATSFLNFLFCLVLGCVYVFTYISVKDAPTRHKYILYYLVCSIENIMCVTIFIMLAPSTLVSIAYLFYPLCAITIAFYYIGIVFMIIYYLYFHPRTTARRSKRIVNNR